MESIHNKLSDPHTGEVRVLGDRSETELVCAEIPSDRGWMRNAPLCQALAQHNIIHTGIMLAKPPLEIVRPDLSGTFFMACFGGSGEVLVDGRWQTIRTGHACLLPPHTTNALRSSEKSGWNFAWVRYLEPEGTVPVATANSPVRQSFDPEPLRHAITGTIAECRGSAQPATIHHWVELIHGYVLRFAQPQVSDDRIWKAWSAVSANLGARWNLEDIAAGAHMSPEHLRRLCLKHLGRSPMKHLTYLRMRHAAELLATTDAKIETVAHEVGYENPFAFSNTFQKWTGIRPSEHRVTTH